MLTGISLTVFTGVLWLGIGITLSWITQHKLDYCRCMIYAGLLSTVACAVLLTRWDVLQEPQTSRTGALVLVFLVAGICQAAGFEVMRRAMLIGPNSAVWSIVQSASVAPYSINIILWGEPLKKTGLVGVGLVILGIILLGRCQPHAKQETSGRQYWVFLAVAAFLLIGVQQTLCTLPSHWENWEDSAQLRPMLLTGMTALGWILLRPFTPKAPGGRIIGSVAALAVCSIVATFTLFAAMDLLKQESMTAAVFPIALGVCISFFALYGKIRLKEQISYTGTALVIAGVVALSL